MGPHTGALSVQQVPWAWAGNQLLPELRRERVQGSERRQGSEAPVHHGPVRTSSERLGGLNECVRQERARPGSEDDRQSSGLTPQTTRRQPGVLQRQTAGRFLGGMNGMPRDALLKEDRLGRAGCGERGRVRAGARASFCRLWCNRTGRAHTSRPLSADLGLSHGRCVYGFKEAPGRALTPHRPGTERSGQSAASMVRASLSSQRAHGQVQEGLLHKPVRERGTPTRKQAKGRNGQSRASQGEIITRN